MSEKVTSKEAQLGKWLELFKKSKEACIFVPCISVFVFVFPVYGRETFFILFQHTSFVTSFLLTYSDMGEGSTKLHNLFSSPSI